MSNSTKDTLHELIKYLSKSEKRYFKVYASRHIIGDENNYVLLFDFIEKQDTYDEEQLFKHFKNEAFLNNFSITKKRLYDQIILALDNFHHTNSIDSQIYRLLSGAEILYKKSLYHQSLKQLTSAQKIAQKHHRYNLLSEISHQMKRVYESQGGLDLNSIQSLFQDDLSYHQKSLTYDKFWNLKSKLFLQLSSKGSSRSKEDLLQFKSIIDELLSEESLSDLYYETDYLYHHIYSAYYFATNSFQDCYHHLNQILHLFEHDSVALKEKANQYLSCLTNAIYVAYRLDLRDDLTLLQKKLKALRNDRLFTSSDDMLIKLFSSSYSIEITIFLLKGQIEDAEKLIPEIERGLVEYADKLTEYRKAFFNFKIATVYLLKGDYPKALKYMNKILQNNQIDDQEELMSIAHLVNLLIHFEIQNDQLIPYVLRNTQRYLKTRNRLYDFEATFLKFISKMTKTSHKIEQEERWMELFYELKKLNDATLQRVSYEFFDFLSWAKAKAERLSVSEVVKQRDSSYL